MANKTDQIRYKLHSEVRKNGYALNTAKRTIYFIYTNNDFPNCVLRLHQEFGYALQSELA